MPSSITHSTKLSAELKPCWEARNNRGKKSWRAMGDVREAINRLQPGGRK
jgi:hypothetical protein